MNKNKFGALALMLALIAIMAAACGGGSKEKVISLGTTSSGSYTNDYFGVSLQFPSEWEAQDMEMVNQLAEAGAELIAGDDEELQKGMDLSQAKTVNLLMASKYPIDTADQPNPSVILVGEKVSLLQGVKDGKDYLEASQELMTQSGLPYEFQEIKEQQVGGKDFHVMEVAVNVSPELSITQNYYSTILEGYAFNIITTHVDDETKAQVEDIIQSVTFK
ncbi:hypothetical protein [Paenibacillus soyae]|uniref:Lipoprotein n=1 Tax=Paenibacillus soyae TaxID=2969249 RepID=A0A9X2MTC2_9BACL|nr:hypothetical protein [Paenibacillus soyae]MCR2805907.1 hypothetical protein [Paenibacillus soyae]